VRSFFLSKQIHAIPDKIENAPETWLRQWLSSTVSACHKYWSVKVVELRYSGMQFTSQVNSSSINTLDAISDQSFKPIAWRKDLVSYCTAVNFHFPAKQFRERATKSTIHGFLKVFGRKVKSVLLRRKDVAFHLVGETIAHSFFDFQKYGRWILMYGHATHFVLIPVSSLMIFGTVVNFTASTAAKKIRRASLNAALLTETSREA
jgi:hypothetical protein